MPNDAPHPPSAPERPTRSVLIVEDEAVVARDVERTLTSIGYRVVGTVRSGRAALRALEEMHPNVVLSDIMIKGEQDGIQLAGVIRERFGIPVVFLSAHADESTVARATSMSPYGYVLKPFRSRELRAALELALHRHALESKLEEQSVTDELTGLYNRRGFMTLATQHLATAKRAGRRALLVFADLNGMKIVNDSLGHDAGDALLRDAAKALQSTFRCSDVVARLGGDEFVVLAVEPDATGGETLPRRLYATVQEMNAEKESGPRLSMSVGVCAWDPIAHPSIEKLVEDADAQMYRAKAWRKRNGSGLMPAVTSEAPVEPRSAETHDNGEGISSSLSVAQDGGGGAHSRRVATHSEAVARRLGYTVEDARLVRLAAMLHDIDKIFHTGFSGDSRPPPAQLTEVERSHPVRGSQILHSDSDVFLRRAALVARHHHERWDGTGHPDGLRGVECPLDARIVAVCDAHDALKHEARWSDERIREHLRSQAGGAFDPAVVTEFLAALEESR
jgi:two-component system cell cycle response regulator